MTGITPWPQAEPAAGPPRRPGAGADLAARYEAGYLPAAGSLLGDERFRGRSVLHVDPERPRERNAADPAARGRDAVPGCDPDRARDLLAPVAALQLAAVYQMFLDNIEPSERVYHAADPADWLARTAALLG